MGLRLSTTNVAFFVLTIVAIAIGCLRIFLTYHVFSQTWDEPFHIAAGMEWLDKGRYTYERFHPPLARVTSALGPYLEGIRSMEGRGSYWEQGNAILQAGGTYERNLTLARIGSLPYFIIASLVVAFWARIVGGMVASLFATVLFTTLPPVLAHSGLATIDMACGALVSAALFLLTLWLKNPTPLRSVAFGISIGMALLTKLSAIGFLGLSGTLIVTVWGLYRWRQRSIHPMMFSLKSWMVSLMIVALLFLLTIWAGYRFSFGFLPSKAGAYPLIDAFLSNGGPLHDGVYYLLQHIPLPAPEFIDGLSDFIKRNKEGDPIYFMGSLREQSRWYFYPVLLLTKTPLPFILLSLMGILTLLRAKNFSSPEQRMQLAFPALSAIAILAIGMIGNVNNGLRQILGIYPVLAIVAGFAAARLLSMHSKQKLLGFAVVALLFSWQFTASFGAHPDYLAYFNELVNNHPEELLVDSDLDWGQDLRRLSIALKRREINKLSIKYNGSEGINLNNFQLPDWHPLLPYRREKGWIAISVFSLRQGVNRPPYDHFAWLREVQPVEKVGKSIWLYYIP